MLGLTLLNDVDRLTTMEEEFEAGFFCYTSAAKDDAIEQTGKANEEIEKVRIELEQSRVEVTELRRTCQELKEAEGKQAAEVAKKAIEDFKESDECGEYAIRKHEGVMARSIIIVHDYVHRGIPNFDFIGYLLVLKVQQRLAYIQTARAMEARTKEIAESPSSIPVATATLPSTSKAIEAAPPKAPTTHPTSKAIEVVTLATIHPKDSNGCSAIESKKVLLKDLILRREEKMPWRTQRKPLPQRVFLQAVSWLAIALLPFSDVSIINISIFLVLGNLGASIVEVANDALVAETGKQGLSSKKPQSSSGELQSFVWMAASIGGVLGNLLGGITVERFSAQTMFIAFGLLLTIQFFTTMSVHENSVNLPRKTSDSGIRKQFKELSLALRKPEIAYSLAWFASSYAVVPVLTGTMFFYQTQHLGLDSSVLGLSKVFGQAAMLLWSVIYNKHLKLVPPRKLISAVQATMVLFMLSDVLFVKQIYRNMGVPDSVYVVVFSGLLEVLFQFKVLPFSVIMAQLCPPGCEGSLMAFLMSAIALSTIVSGYLGVILASYVGVSADDFEGLPHGILIQAACTFMPLFWSSWIPSDVKLRKEKQ
ncbi:hypothetical protein NE237_026535 [Protea cynaroides]|uniref:Folate-biopterin transporter 7 n=1 Tax=Protea cynaroides TaxID=273540 RepID=A0A9Q0H943_9MAGN|nr:hypothetical protein NE237_026535 [Protea cynaroides]